MGYRLVFDELGDQMGMRRRKVEGGGMYSYSSGDRRRELRTWGITASLVPQLQFRALGDGVDYAVRMLHCVMLDA